MEDNTTKTNPSNPTSLSKLIETFIDNDCLFKKNPPFTISFSQPNPKTNNFSVIYDRKHFIPCILAIPKNEESLINDKTKTETKIIVNDSCFELVLYKNEKEDNLVLKFLLFIIIKDIKKSEEEPLKKEEEKIININEDFGTVDNLSTFLFDYVKSKNDLVNKYKDEKINIVDKIFFDINVKENIRFFNEENKNLINEENKNDIIKLKGIKSQIEIKENLIKGDEKIVDNEKIISNVLDMLNPSYKSDLIDDYYDEMPEELAEVNRRYKHVNITNNKYSDFVKNKGEMEVEKEGVEEENFVEEVEAEEEHKRGRKKKKENSTSKKNKGNKENKEHKEKKEGSNMKIFTTKGNKGDK